MSEYRDKARRSIEIGVRSPYAQGSEAEGPAKIAALGVLSDLSDRRAIKWGLQDVDEDIRDEIVDSLAAIISEAMGESA